MKKTIGEQIKRLRKNKMLTQEKLAELVGCSRSAIINYENGLREPQFETLDNIAIALGRVNKYFQVADSVLENLSTEELIEELKRRDVNKKKGGIIMNEDIERAREIVKTLRSGADCDRESLIEELREIEDKYILIFY